MITRTADGWKKSPAGGWVSPSGSYSVRGPIMGQKMYWLYYRAPGEKAGSRWTPTGRYQDAVNFTTVKAAKAFVASLERSV